MTHALVTRNALPAPASPRPLRAQAAGPRAVVPAQAGPELVGVYGRPVGRRRSRDTALHAVPGTDRTRSALCGARVGGQALPWTGLPRALPPGGTCAECAQLAGPRSA